MKNRKNRFYKGYFLMMVLMMVLGFFTDYPYIVIVGVGVYTILTIAVTLLEILTVIERTRDFNITVNNSIEQEEKEND